MAEKVKLTGIKKHEGVRENDGKSNKLSERDTAAEKRATLLLMFFRRKAEAAPVDCTAENNNTALK